MNESRIGLFGKGRLGSAIAAAAGARLAWCVSREAPPPQPVAVAIEASSGKVVSDRLAWALERQVDLVIGSTGWEISDLATRVGERIGVVVAPNFSLAVALLARLATVLGRFAAHDPTRDPYLVEHHHAKKHDAPSGTARLLARQLIAACPRKRSFGFAQTNAPLPDDVLSVASVRAGATYSSHWIGIDAPAEVLEVRHEARSAAAFAQGALAAADWVRGRRGVFAFDDVARELLEPLFAPVVGGGR